VVRSATVVGLADLTAVYTWRTWLFGWVVRMLSQVLFYVTAGQALAGPGRAKDLVVGNALMVCATEATMVVASSAWERFSGTLPLLAVAPIDMAWVFVGRSVQWLVSGTATSLVALLVLGPFFGVRLSLVRVLVAGLLVAATAVSTYCLALFLAALVLDAPRLRNLVGNLAYLVMMAICGVQVPVGFWPPPVQAVAYVIPLTHQLNALRAALDGASPLTVVLHAGLGLLLAAGWLAVAAVAFQRFARRGRRDGSFEYGG
jgi:ABC-2 type transport system permease protein